MSTDAGTSTEALFEVTRTLTAFVTAGVTRTTQFARAEAGTLEGVQSRPDNTAESDVGGCGADGTGSTVMPTAAIAKAPASAENIRVPDLSTATALWSATTAPLRVTVYVPGVRPATI